MVAEGKEFAKLNVNVGLVEAKCATEDELVKWRASLARIVDDSGGFGAWLACRGPLQGSREGD